MFDECLVHFWKQVVLSLTWIFVSALINIRFWHAQINRKEFEKKPSINVSRCPLVYSSFYHLLYVSFRKKETYLAHCVVCTYHRMLHCTIKDFPHRKKKGKQKVFKLTHCALLKWCEYPMSSVMNNFIENRVVHHLSRSLLSNYV